MRDFSIREVDSTKEFDGMPIKQWYIWGLLKNNFSDKEECY